LSDQAVRTYHGVPSDDQLTTLTQNPRSGSDPAALLDSDGSSGGIVLVPHRALGVRKGVAVIHHHDGWPKYHISHDMDVILRGNQASPLYATPLFHYQNW
jgi:hypothetical protein